MRAELRPIQRTATRALPAPVAPRQRAAVPLAPVRFAPRPAPKREIGIISDLDKTLIPTHDKPPIPKPYPGAVALLRALEFGGGGLPGDTHYVTGRTEETCKPVHPWLKAHGFPSGPVQTGESDAPAGAHRDKVRDIVRIFEENPGQKFVLLGDSKHVDPEVYAEIRSRFPDRVAAILIHRVTEDLAPSRVAGMIVFAHHAQAAAELFTLGVLSERDARGVAAAARREGLAFDDAQLFARV